MPRFRIVEERCFKSGILIDAVDEDAAQRGDGDIIETAETDSWGFRLLEVEEVDADAEYLEL